MTSALGPLIHDFIERHLKVRKALQPTSIRSYRDALRIFLTFVARDAEKCITSLNLADLTIDRTQKFLRYLEESRGNHARTYNHRLAVVRTLFEYLASCTPKMAAPSRQVSAIPVKAIPVVKASPMEQEDLAKVFQTLPRKGKHALRDGTLILFLYNTGINIQDLSCVLAGHLELGAQPRIMIPSGKGAPRACSLWPETANALDKLLAEEGRPEPHEPVFCSRRGVALTRSGIYKILRRLSGGNHTNGTGLGHTLHPHLLRTNAAQKPLAGIASTSFRSWLLNVGTRSAPHFPASAHDPAVRPDHLLSSDESPDKDIWKDDESLLGWLNSL
jgi:integrase/recombinase XerD